MSIDFASIAASALVNSRSLLDSWLPGGRLTGDNYVVRNPTRNDETVGSFSINIKTGYWADFATPDRGGDLISLYAYINGISQSDAAKRLGGTPEPPPRTNPELPDVLLDPVPDNAPPVPAVRNVKIGNEWIHYDIKYYWPYKNQAGQIRFYVVRYETPEGKETPPLTIWKQSNGQLKWRFKGIDGTQPIFNLDNILKYPDAQVIVVEGEKKADLLQLLIESFGAEAKLVATCWPGGAQRFNKVDWTPLRGRSVICWPDFDRQKNKKTGQELPTEEQPGYSAMFSVCKILNKLHCQLLMIRPTADKPSAWDVADAIETDGWTLQDIMAFIKTNRFKPDLPVPKPANPETVPEEPPPPPPDPDDWPFQCLGYDNGVYYYLAEGTRQVSAIKAEAHGPGTLLALASLPWWERNFSSKQGPQWRLASNNIMRHCESKGVYSTDRQRGRGAWYDKGRSILHLGDYLIVDGTDTKLDKIESRYIYEAAPPMEHDRADPLSTREANKFQRISDMLYWERPLFSKLFTGWAVCATICGALTHRPSVWLTARAGSGKSFVVDKILHPILGNFSLHLAAVTTEAGIRQKLKNDALAVLIDEFEGTDFNSQSRVQSILELARLSFSDDGAQIAKGGQAHKGVSYLVRSCFFMSSVGVNLYQHADETRVSVISLEKPYDLETETKEVHFDGLAKAVAETLTPEWCAAFRLRAIKNIPMIRKNSDIFERVVASKLGTRRSGDQVGALLAGAFSLCSDKIITEEVARQWIDQQDWSDQIAVAEKSDERNCLSVILESTVKRPGRNDEVSIAELLQELEDFTDANLRYTETEEYRCLIRNGIRFDRDEKIIWIADSQLCLKRILKNSAWEKSWARQLLRIEGAVTKRLRFLGPQCAATGIPWIAAMGE
jgi:putative DNA primase/helicase